MSEDQIQLIQIDLIDRPVKISRELIDPERVRELAESIRESGLLQPIILRPSNGRFEIVAGDRRYLAHKLLNFKEIKSIVLELDDRETVIIRGIENLQRVDLTPSEEGRVYLLLREEGGLSTRDISKKTGKAFGTIDRYLNLARCPEHIRRAVDLKQVSLNVLEILQEIEDPEAFDYHWKQAVYNGISATVARLWVDDYLKSKEGTYYGDDGNPPQSNVEIEVKPIFITCEVCHGPTEIRNVCNIVACKVCRQKVRHV
jgi:ParB family chromosome partitioning protein